MLRARRSRRASSSTRASRASASETATHSHDGDRLRQRLGPRLRGRRARGRRARRRATRRGRRPDALRDPDRPQGPLRRRREAADRLEPPCSTRCPTRDCDVWARLAAEGMVLLGHLHTHEFACGGTTDQVGNPWALERSAGGSSGGSGAALASRQVPAATGTDTAGSLRIPSAECGTSTIKPTRGLVSMRGIVPLAPTFDHPGPMTRTVARLRAAARCDGGRGRHRPRAGRSAAYAVSPRIADLDPDVADGFDRALAALPGRARRAAAATGPARRRSPTTSTSSSPRCSCITAASTTGGTGTARRIAGRPRACRASGR